MELWCRAGQCGMEAESRGHGWSEVTALGSAAGRLSLACSLLEEKAKLTGVFQAGSQPAII